MPGPGNEVGLTATSELAVRFDALGIAYIAFAGFWTLLLAAAIGFLFRKRNMSFLRIRGLYLTFASVFFLHSYWCLVQTGYATAGIMPGQVPFLFMGLWYPIGIGLFHAANTQLLHVAKAQSRFTRPDGNGSSRLLQPDINAKNWFQRLAYSKKVVLVVSVGFALQATATLLMYFLSRKFHPAYGIIGTEMHGSPVQLKMQMGTGWEWWPSLTWQFFWAWLVAPIVLWRSRNINDTHCWRLQTIACCLSGLHAAPMWLIALYVPAMAPINKFFIPPQWICISIVAIDIFSLFLPCWQVFKHQALTKETLEIIAAWEEKTQGRDYVVVDYYSGLDAGKSIAEIEADATRTQETSLYTMGALEHTLARNPDELHVFAAMRDFSGENIAFLRSLIVWKLLWPNAGDPTGAAAAARRTSMLWNRRTPPIELTRRELFKRAVDIYVNYIGVGYAEFPINISARETEYLDRLFASAAHELYGSSRNSSLNEILPFDSDDFRNGVRSTATGSGGDDMIPLYPLGRGATVAKAELQYCGEVPADFDAYVFGDAERSVKYLVLTNTWPRFVKEKRARGTISALSV